MIYTFHRIWQPSQPFIPLPIFLWLDFVDTYVTSALACFKDWNKSYFKINVDYTQNSNNRLISCTLQQFPSKYISSFTPQNRNTQSKASIKPEQPRGKRSQLIHEETRYEITTIKSINAQLPTLKPVRTGTNIFLNAIIVASKKILEWEVVYHQKIYTKYTAI